MKTNKKVRIQFKFGICIILIITCISCSEKSDYPAKIEMVDGIKTLTNPDYPRDGKFVLSLEEELSIGEGKQEGHFFANPGDICVSDDGSVLVSDFDLLHISCFNELGNYIRSFGRKGEGPGDFLFFRFTLNPNKNIYTVDFRNARISILDLKGNYLNGFKVLNLGQWWNKIYSDKDGNIYISKEQRTEKGYMTSIHRYDSSGKELLSYGEFPGDPFLFSNRDGKTIQSRSSATPTTVWTVSENGRLYAGYSDDYLISVYNKEGVLQFRFGRRFDPVPDTQNWLEGISDHHPVFSRSWILDEAGNLWIELYSLDREQDRIYDIFSPDGVYLKQVQIKHRIITIKNQRAYCIVPSEEELPLVKRYRLIEMSDTNL